MRRRWLLAAVASLLACARPAPPLPPTAPSAPLHLAPLADLVPAASLRWIVEAKPRVLLANPAAIVPLTRTLPEATLDAMAHARGGVDLRAIDDLVLAGYPFSTLSLAHQVVDPAKVEAAFTAHVADVLGRAIDTPSQDPRESVVRVWGGSGKEHETLVLFGREAVGLASGVDAPLRAAELFATGRLKRSRPAWHAAPLDEIAKLVGEGDLRAAAPGPFTGEWASGLEGLLASATGVGAAATLEEQVVRVRVALTGPWGARSSEAEEHVERVYATLTTGGFGRLLGLDHPVVPATFTTTPESVCIAVTFAIGPLVRGLGDATVARVEDALRPSLTP